MRKKNHIPPPLATKLLHGFLRDDLREDVIGDLKENFDFDVDTRTPFAARVNYWKQVLHYVRPFAIRKIKRTTSNPTTMYKNYFKTAMKNMASNKLHAFINISGLATGIAVAIIISLWIYDELSFNKQFANHARIGQVIQNVTNNGQVETWGNVPWPLGDEIRQNYGADFKYLAMVSHTYPHTLTVGDQKFSRAGMYAASDFLLMFDVQLMKGTMAKWDPFTLLLSASSAEAFFGTRDPIGQMIHMDDLDFQVGGVYRDFPERSQFADVSFLAPWSNFVTLAGLEKMEDPWRPNGFLLYAMLNEQSSFETASVRIKDAKLKKVNEALAKKRPALFLHAMDDWHLRSDFANGQQTGGRMTYVWMFAIVAVFVLLMACINFMNLSTARSEKRAKEVGIRKAVGSYRSQLITQFFSESILITFLSLLLALGLAQMVLPLFNTMAEKKMTLPWTHPYLWIAIVAATVVIGLVAGSYPALYLSAIRPAGALKGARKAGHGAALARKTLVILQFSVSVTMIIGTTAVFLQIQHGKSRPLGYNVSGLITIPGPTQEVHAHFDAIKKQLVDAGAIIEMSESVAPATDGWGSSSRIDWKGKDPDLSIDFSVFEGSYEYGRTLQWEVLEGRDFSRNFPSDSMTVILNEAAAEYLNRKEVVGETLRSSGQDFTIVGVVRDVVYGNPYQPVRPALYFLSRQPMSFLTLRLNPKNSAAGSIADIEAVIKPYMNGNPFHYDFVDISQASKFGNEQKIGTLASVFAGLAIFISCLGIFGLSSFMAERRTKEIGLRKVLGASLPQLWLLMSKDFVFLVIVSCLIASPVAYLLLQTWLDGYTYRIGLPWWMFVAATGGTLFITVVASSWHMLRAASSNPVNSLKVE